MRLTAVLIPCALLFAAAHSQLSAQTVTFDTLGEARRARDAGSYPRAVHLLEPWVSAHPHDVDARWLLGQTRYWMGDNAGALSDYSAALAMRPGDVELRVDFGRMLVATSDRARARDVLLPVLGSTGGRGRAEELLGTLAYWEGNHPAAQRLFHAALEADPANESARNQLHEIARATASWIRIGAGALHDDQVLNSVATEMAAGWFATPTVVLTVRARPEHFAVEAANSSAGLFEGTLAAYVPSARLEGELAGGVVTRSFGESAEAIWRVSGGIRFPGGLTVRGRSERAPYHATVASVTTAVTTTAATLSAHWKNRHGWLAEAAARRDRYPDANSMDTRYAWVRGPTLRGSGGELHLGYGFRTQDARESRYVFFDSTRTIGQPPAASGAYIPYHTPHDLMVHSLLAGIVLRPHRRLDLNADASLGLLASEVVAQRSGGGQQPPPGLPIPGQPQPQPGTISFVERSFTPVELRTSIVLRLGSDLHFRAGVGYERTAFYSASSALVQLTWSFSGAAIRRAERG